MSERLEALEKRVERLEQIEQDQDDFFNGLNRRAERFQKERQRWIDSLIRSAQSDDLSASSARDSEPNFLGGFIPSVIVAVGAVGVKDLQDFVGKIRAIFDGDSKNSV
jgi:hypothetical protein